MRTFGCALLLAFAAALAAAQQPRLRLDLPAVAARATEVNDVTLDGAVLHLGMAFLDHDDSLNRSDREALSQLQGIYVKTFEFDHDAAVSDADLAPIREQLKSAGWTRIVSVHSSRHGQSAEDDEVYICTASAGTISGMAIISREGHELDLVNIVGNIRPDQIAALGGHLGIPMLDFSGKDKSKGPKGKDLQ